MMVFGEWSHPVINSWTLHCNFLSPVQLWRGAIERLWWVLGIQPLQSFWWRMWANHENFGIKVVIRRGNGQNRPWTMLESRMIMGNLCCNCGDGSRGGFFINHPLFNLCCDYVIFVEGITFLVFAFCSTCYECWRPVSQQMAKLLMRSRD